MPMCGRYYLKSEDMNTVITSLLRSLESKSGDGVKTGGEIYPGDTAPVLAPNRAGLCRAFFMDWGYPLHGKRIINARSETAAQKPLFRDGMRSRRCIIPASCYYEWGKIDHQKYNFHPEAGKGLLLAGIYRPEPDGRYSYTVLTRDAAPHLVHLHPRMPLILPADAVTAWLTPGFDPDAVIRNARTDIAFAPAPLPLDKTASDTVY